MERWAEYRDRPSWLVRGLFVVLLLVLGWSGLRVLLGPSMSRSERTELEARIDAIVETAMEEGPITGVAIAVSRGLQVLHLEGYGFADVENDLPVDPSTIFHIGSISKQFTAAAMLRLEADGLVDLDAPASRYLAETLGERAALFDDVTVSQLLNHTSGVRDYTIVPGWWTTLGIDVDPEGLVESFVNEPRDFPPGDRFSYSNSGYALAGMIVEAVSGQPFGGWLNEHLFVPNDLAQSAYCDDSRVMRNRARGYRYAESGELRHPRYVSMTQAYAAGGLCASAEDLLRWTRLLTRGVITGDDGWDVMSTPGTLRDGSRIEYGYGIAVSYLEGRHRIGHIGGMLGFTGQMAHYSEEDVSIVVLTNTEGANAARIETEIARAVLELAAEQVRDVELTPTELTSYVGAYDLGATVVRVTEREGRLEAEVSTPGIEGRYVMLYQGDLTFFAQTDPSIIARFDEPADGEPLAFTLEHKGITLRGRKVE
ncbi:MAG: serine hydrolase domain-containing protein [Gemmatimonadota bacterium]